MRVLFAAHGSWGHVLPLVGVARATKEAGHQVQIATSEDFSASVQRLDIEAKPAGIGDAEMVAEARRRWPEVETEPPSRWAPRMFREIAGPRMAADLAVVITRWQPDLVVREEGEYGTPIAAAEAGVPWVTHGWGSPLPTGTSREYGAAVLDPCPPSLYAAPPGLHMRQPVRPGAVALRATPDSLGGLPAPVAYVGFGTVPLYRDRPKLIAALVEALLGHGFTAVVTTPDAALGSQLAALDPGRVHVAEWVSLPSLIERCDLVVCHGGAGTVLGSLAAGVPLVLVPQGAPSQLRMSRACAERGVGIALDPGRLVRAELDRALGEFIANDGFKAAAAEVAVEIADMPSCDKAARSLQAITYAASGSQA